MSLKQLTQQQPSRPGHLGNQVDTLPKTESNLAILAALSLVERQLSFALHLQLHPNLAINCHQEKQHREMG
jgi:hypothetical protein